MWGDGQVLFVRSAGGLQFWRKIIKMGPHASKMDLDGIILGGFDPKITILMSISVRNLTFDRFLKIFEKF